MKKLILTALLASALLSASSETTTAHAAARKNCRLTNAGGCVKLGNGWMEFCPADGDERIDVADKNDKDCVSVKPFLISEYSSSTGQRYPLLSGTQIDFQPIDRYSRTTFSSDCSDPTMPCAINPSSIEAVKFSVGLNTTSETQIIIDLYVFSQGGTLQFDGRQYTVAPGSFKWDLRSPSYTYTNPGADTLTLDVEMKTLGGLLDDHVVNRTSDRTYIDSVMVAPNRFTYTPSNLVESADASNTLWSSATATKTTRSGSTVISFALQGTPSGNAFRFDPFVSVPEPVKENGSGDTVRNTKAAAAAAALLGAVIGVILL